MSTDRVSGETRTMQHEDGDREMGKDIAQSSARSPGVEDPELQGLTLYEKKAWIVNRELDSQGMGRYQWMIFFLCGFGYLIDLLWAQAFGLILASVQQEFGFSDAKSGDLGTSFSAGLTAGAAFWGIIVDIIGRYWSFNFTVLCASIFGICLGAPDTYNALLVLTAFTGLGIGGNIPIDTTICLETLPQNKRWLLPTLSLFQPIGVVLSSAFAYAFIPPYSCAADLKSCNNTPAGQPCCTKADNYGWRYLMFTLGGITIFVFLARFVVFRFQESPKFLLYRGRDEEAVKSLQYIAKYNKVECGVTLETFTSLVDDIHSTSTNDSDRPMLGAGSKQASAKWTTKLRMELERYKMLFSSWTMTQLVVCVWVIYMFDYWGFTLAGYYLPILIRRKSVALGASLRSTYRSYIYIYLFGIPGVLAGTVVYGYRRLSLFFSFALFGAMLFTFTAVDSQAAYIGINGLVYFFQSMANGILYGLTPELFPAPIRGTACGVSSFWGRLFSIIAPIAGAQVLQKSLNGVLYLAGGGVFISTLFTLLLPGKYLNSQSY